MEIKGSQIGIENNACVFYHGVMNHWNNLGVVEPPSTGASQPRPGSLRKILFFVGKNTLHGFACERNWVRDLQRAAKSSEDCLNLRVRVLWAHLALSGAAEETLIHFFLFAELWEINFS